MWTLVSLAPINVTAYNLLDERIDEICFNRIALFENEFAKVVKPNSYPVKKFISVRAAILANFPEKAPYKDEVRKIKVLSSKPARESLKWINCLLEANQLLRKLDYIAKQGGRDLDDFSNNWRHSFRGPARKLGYRFK